MRPGLLSLLSVYCVCLFLICCHPSPADLLEQAKGVTLLKSRILTSDKGTAQALARRSQYLNSQPLDVSFKIDRTTDAANPSQHSSRIGMTIKTTDGQRHELAFTLPEPIYEQSDLDWIIVGDRVIFGYVQSSVPDKKDQLAVAVYNWRTETLVHQGAVHSTTWGLRYITLAYLEDHEEILFVWSDLSEDFKEQNFRSTVIKLDDILAGKSLAAPAPFFRNMGWQYDKPNFYEVNGKIIVATYTGYNFGAFAYSGVKSAGIGTLDQNGKISHWGLVSMVPTPISYFSVTTAGVIVMHLQNHEVREIDLADIYLVPTK